MSKKNKMEDLLFLPIIFLKQTGELFLTTFVYLFSSLYATYRLILFLILSLINLFGKPVFILTKIGRQSFLFNKQSKKIPNFYRKKIKIVFLQLKFFLLGSLTIGASLLIIELNNFIRNLPNPKQIIVQGFPATTKIYDRKGTILYEVYDNYNRTPVKFKQIPKKLIEATIASEDKDFYIHNGISLRGIIRAIVHNSTSDSLEGGSTITQQLIRSSYLTPEKTYFRKIKEIILAIWIEQVYSKDQILEMYLNQIPYGGTTWGIESAAKTYFDKIPSDLTLSEIAFLAGIPAAPSKYSTFNIEVDPNYKHRQTEILEKMLDEKYITKQEFNEAKNEKLTFGKQRVPIAAPHFVMYVRDLLNKYYGRRLTETGGLRVTTSLDLNLQENAQIIVSDEIDKVADLRVSNGGVLITNPKNGEILAMVGSKDYFDQENDGNVNVTLAKRQPGSSIKVVNYAAALANGFTAATMINDAPVSYTLGGRTAYKPVNYDGKFHGMVSLRSALGSSLNIPAVKILNEIGIDKMLVTGKKMGIDTWNNPERYGLSLTLGGAEVTMTDMAEVYGTLANGGKRRDLKALVKVTDYNGRELPLPYEKAYDAIPETVSFIISNILSDNQARLLAFGANSLLNITNKTVSVKTGTSDNKRDNWTIGYTKDFVVTVWVGNNDNSPMNPKLTSGVTGASPIWRKIMDLILKDFPYDEIRRPEGIVTLKCNTQNEFFIEGTITKNPCKKKLIARIGGN